MFNPKYPPGTYRAVKHEGDGVCPGLPDLVDFEMVVRNGPYGQNARLTFQDRRAALADQPPTTSSGSFELAFHNRVSLGTLERIGSLETGELLNCFGFERLTPPSAFVADLYARLSLVKPPFCTQLIFCQTKGIGLVVGIGRNLNKNSKLESFDYGFKLELQSAKETAALPKEGELNAGAPPGDRLLDLPLESQGAYHTPPPIDDSRGGIGWEYSGGPSASMFDGLYETQNTTGFDQLTKISVNISRAQADHPRVELVVEFPHYEVELCEESAVYQEGCLLLDFSKGANDSEMLIFGDTLGLDYLSPTSFRICQREGGELVLMFDASRYSEGMPSTTVQLRLRKVNLS
ncbi:hypothetical protein FOZ60_005453 [Perkinsus olseni]|uniref:Uncharacterized protein n=1 Tax=Perkinsus olseni TaxID=32597 RepID=A0A7J6NR17_PEROL|nr:hypothetical protein FOZ60_005453 [Perkinsus olseni]